MGDEIETTTDTISELTGTWFYASRFLLRKYGIEDIGTNQYVLSEWLKNNNIGKVDRNNFFIPGNSIVIPKDKFNVLRIIGIRLFEENTFGEFYDNHAIVLNISLEGDTSDKNRLLELINNYSYHQYAFYKEGILYRTDKTNEKISSKMYSTILEKGVNDTDTQILVFLKSNGIINIRFKHPDLGIITIYEEDIKNNKGGGVTFCGDSYRGIIFVAITGNNGRNRITNIFDIPPEYVLMHELVGHAIPAGLEGLDQLDAIDIEEVIAKELKISVNRAKGAPPHYVKK